MRVGADVVRLLEGATEDDDAPHQASRVSVAHLVLELPRVARGQHLRELFEVAGPGRRWRPHAVDAVTAGAGRAVFERLLARDRIARELVETVRNNVTIDWTLRENVRAQLRVLVKRILRKHGYPPDKQEKATQTVLEQAEVICGELAA